MVNHDAVSTLKKFKNILKEMMDVPRLRVGEYHLRECQPSLSSFAPWFYDESNVCGVWIAPRLSLSDFDCATGPGDQPVRRMCWCAGPALNLGDVYDWSQCTPTIGKYFTSFFSCEETQCTNAELGYYYTSHGGDTDTCQTAPCTPPRLGLGWSDKWATSDNCPTFECSPPPVGKKFATPGDCAHVECTNAPAGNYYTTAETCEFAECAGEPPSGKGYTKGWSDKPDGCPTKPCADIVLERNETLPDGYYFKSRCEFAKCSNAPKGYYYNSNGGTENACSFSPCVGSKVGEEFVSGWSNSPDGCPSQKCPDLEAGYTYNQAGNCSRIPCTGAQRGQYYKGDCSSQQCDDPGVGLFFTTPGNCDTQACTNGPPRSVYTSSGDAQGQCQFKECDAPGIGQTYVHEDPNHPNACDLKDCEVKAGYEFVTAGDCEGQKCPEANLAIGHYYAEHPTDPYGKPCEQQEECTDRGNNKFLAGFSASPTDCPKEACLTALPRCGFASLDECTPKADCTTNPTNIANQNTRTEPDLSLTIVAVVVPVVLHFLGDETSVYAEF